MQRACKCGPRRWRRSLNTPTHNRLLDSLPAELQATLLPQFERVRLPLHAELFNPDQPPRYVHLPVSGIASVVTTMEGGEAIEVGLVGHEGIAERVHLLGPQRGSTRCFMQVAGEGLRMDFKRFQNLFLETPALLRAVHRFLQQDSLVLAQLSACNRLHEVEARLARWLLMVQDRISTSELLLTQEFLSEMLGTRRSTVNISVGILQRAGMITFSRGRINIESRDLLESVACECYPIIEELFRTLYA